MMSLLRWRFTTSRTAVVHITQNLSPSMFPSFIQLQVPAITTLHFRETEADSGLLKIYRQEDSWTLEGKWEITFHVNKSTNLVSGEYHLGLIQSMPLMSFWYNDVLRVVMGKLVTATGDLLDAALRHAHKMSMRGREIQRRSRDLAIENMEKLDEYRANLHENYLEGIRGWHHQYQDHQDDYLLEDDFRPVKESRNGNNDFYD